MREGGEGQTKGERGKQGKVEGKKERGGGRGSSCMGKESREGRREGREESEIVNHVMACVHTESQSSLLDLLHLPHVASQKACVY